MKYAYQCLFVCVDHARSEEGDVWFSFARVGGKAFFLHLRRGGRKNKGKVEK